MHNVDDYIILNSDFNDVVKNSVGVIEEVYIDTNSYLVFFIGLREELIVKNDLITLLDISKTGKPYDYKICNICHILKQDFVDFEINQTDALGRKTTRPSCRECRVGINGVNLLPSERRKMNAIKPKKFFVCPICGKGCIPDITAQLVIDHCHNTGKAREWICDSCNTGLGRFKDDINYLNKAIEYLDKYEAQNISEDLFNSILK